MSAGRFPVRTSLPDDMSSSSTRHRPPQNSGRQTIATVITDKPAKLFSVVILDKDVPVLFSNSFGMFAGKKGPSGSP